MRGRQLLERRQEMVKLRSQGVPLRDIITDFTRKYTISEEALYIDWGKRKRWIRDVVRLQDPSLIDEMLEGLKQVLPRAWFVYTTTKNDSIKIASLKLAKETYIDIIELLQSLGIIIKVPDQIEVVAPWLNKFVSQPMTTSPTEADKKASTTATQDSES